MTLRGIDISNWQHTSTGGYTNAFNSAYPSSDFVIIKATQGGWYVNPYCDADYQKARKDGKLLGVYHYAEGGSAKAEAEFFYKNIKGYVKQAIPCLDWESNQNKSWGSTAWAWSFAQRFHELSGVWPMIYVQASAIKQVASCADFCALWVAGYPDSRTSWTPPKFPYSISPWKTYTVWQYTSAGGIDRNTANLDRNGWLRIAGAPAAESKQEEKGMKPTYSFTVDGVTVQAYTVQVKSTKAGTPGKYHLTYEKPFSKTPKVLCTAHSGVPGTGMEGATQRNGDKSGVDVFVTRLKDTETTTVDVLVIGA